MVFSPLIALIQDQLLACREKGIRCESLNSKCTAASRTAIIEVLDYLSGIVRLRCFRLVSYYLNVMRQV